MTSLHKDKIKVTGGYRDNASRYYTRPNHNRVSIKMNIENYKRLVELFAGTEELTEKLDMLLGRLNYPKHLYNEIIDFSKMIFSYDTLTQLQRRYIDIQYSKRHVNIKMTAENVSPILFLFHIIPRDEYGIHANLYLDYSDISYTLYRKHDVRCIYIVGKSSYLTDTIVGLKSLDGKNQSYSEIDHLIEPNTRHMCVTDNTWVIEPSDFLLDMLTLLDYRVITTPTLFFNFKEKKIKLNDKKVSVLDFLIAIFLIEDFTPLEVVYENGV